MPTQLTGINSRQTLQDQITSVDKMLSNPVTAQAVKRKDKILEQYKRDKQRLEKITPREPENDVERKALVDRAQALEQAMVNGIPERGIDSMPTRIEMWENPAGSVGKHTRWEKFWKQNTLAADNRTIVRAEKGYGGVFQWKDYRRRIFKEREQDDPDVSNIEMFRPDVVNKHTLRDYQKRTYAPGQFMSYEAYDQATGHVPTGPELKMRSAIEEARPPAPEDIYLPQRERRQVTPEQVEQEYLARPDAVLGRCQAINKGSRVQCFNRAKPGSNYCGSHRKLESEPDGTQN